MAVRPAADLHASRDSLYRTAGVDDKAEPGQSASVWTAAAALSVLRPRHHRWARTTSQAGSRRPARLDRRAIAERLDPVGGWSGATASLSPSTARCAVSSGYFRRETLRRHRGLAWCPSPDVTPACPVSLHADGDLFSFALTWRSSQPNRDSDCGVGSDSDTYTL